MPVEATPRILRIGDHEIDLSQTTLKAADVAAIWGVSPWEVYVSRARGDLPVAPLVIGKRILRWSTAAVLRSVEFDIPPGTLTGDEGVTPATTEVVR